MSFRERLIITGFIFFGALIITRLFYWQIIKGPDLSKKAEDQYYNQIKLTAGRGKILANDGFPFVANTESYLLYADLSLIKTDKEEAVKKITPFLFVCLQPVYTLATDSAKVVDCDLQYKEKEQQIREKLNNTKVVWILLGQKISKETKEKIETLDYNFLIFEREDKRDYPEASVAAHLLGFVGKDINGEDTGYFGLEGYFDRQIKGKDGAIYEERDALGRPIIIGERRIKTAKQGRDLWTSIDRSAQFLAEQELIKGIKETGAKKGTIIIIDPQTGKLLALATWPHYDPEEWSRYEKEIYKNPAAADLFEPGSIMKPLIVAAAINEGKIQPQTRCPVCAGPLEIGGYTIRTFNNVYHPNLTVTEILENSDNIGMIYVGRLLGKDKLYEYLTKKYQFNSLSGIDLQEEESGKVKDKKDLYEVDTLTMTFGQGININSLQMVRAFSILANGGYLINPYIVEKITDNGKTVWEKKVEKKKILEKKTASVLSEMLVSVTEKSPLHFPKDRIPELSAYRIAAKSGTAQISIGGKYQEGKTIGSVIGFAPVENAKFLILVKLDEPANRPWGSDTAGPIFFNLVRDLLVYYKIPPQ